MRIVIAMLLLCSCSASNQTKCWKPESVVRGVRFKGTEPKYDWSGGKWIVRPYQSKMPKW